jgi:serine/threonine-protein kinase
MEAQQMVQQNPNFWYVHMLASSVYIEKGMFSEAIAEARKSKELNSASAYCVGFLAYALARSGDAAAARSVLEELLKQNSQGYISPYTIALAYNGLGERTETLSWLERGITERDPKMVFLKVEPKWNNLRGDPGFEDLLRRLGF